MLQKLQQHRIGGQRAHRRICAAWAVKKVKANEQAQRADHQVGIDRQHPPQPAGVERAGPIQRHRAARAAPRAAKRRPTPAARISAITVPVATPATPQPKPDTSARFEDDIGAVQQQLQKEARSRVRPRPMNQPRKA